MPYVVVLPDGAADEPVPYLEGRTPLEAARKPNMDWISTNGRQGCAVTVPKGFLPGSDVATLSLLGYDPARYYSGRAPLEAAARGLSIGPEEQVFRCNFVTVVDGAMEDFTAGHITQSEAERLIDDLNSRFAEEGCRFYAGVSYRNLMVTGAAPDREAACTPPHDFPGRPVSQHLPRGPGAGWLARVMHSAHDLLAEHDVNLVRRDLGEGPATDIWLWGQGRLKSFESFHSRFGLHAGVIAAVDLVRGIARATGMEIIDVPGATGYLDTDYKAKGEKAVAALNSFDMVVVHIEAPDEAGHLGDAAAKVEAIERIDEQIVGPLIERLRRCDEWRILVAPDHPTPVGKKVHTSTPPPFCMAGDSVPADSTSAFSENAAAHSGLHIDPAHELMEYFLRG